MDSNQRRRKPTDLQSAPFSHSGTPPQRTDDYGGASHSCQAHPEDYFHFLPRHQTDTPDTRTRPAKGKFERIAIGVHIFVRPRLQQRFASLLKTKDRHHTTSCPECQAGRRKNFAISMPGNWNGVGWSVWRRFGCRGDGLDIMLFVVLELGSQIRCCSRTLRSA